MTTTRETVTVKCCRCHKRTTTTEWTACECRNFGLCVSCASGMTEDERLEALSEARCSISHRRDCDMHF